MFTHPGFFCVVAERGGRVVGSNCLDERSAIAGIGPITIDPSAQNRGVGRSLMIAVMDRAADCKCPGVRLVQAAFHNRSMSLYAKLGFDIREPLATRYVGVCMGTTVPQNSRMPSCTERRLWLSDTGKSLPTHRSSGSGDMP